MNVWESILMFFAFQAVLLSVFFSLKSKGLPTANRLFALFLILFAYNVFFNVLFWSKFDKTLLATLAFTYYLPMGLYGPVYYLYVRTVVTEKKPELKHLLHFVPFLVYVLVFADFFILSTTEKIYLFQNQLAGPYIAKARFFDYAFTGLMLFYGIFTYRTHIKKFKKDFELKQWFKILHVHYLMFTLSWVAYYVLVYFQVLTLEMDYFITFLMVALIGMVSYFSFVQPELFSGSGIKNVIPLIKYEKTGLTPSFSRELRQKLETIMANQKPYLNPDLRLNDIADLLDVSRHHASQVINQHFNMSFFDFINKYRVEEAVKLLSDNRLNLSISEVAYDCGFNNRVSFYKTFKKEMGTTPTEFKEQSIAS